MGGREGGTFKNLKDDNHELVSKGERLMGIPIQQGIVQCRIVTNIITTHVVLISPLMLCSTNIEFESSFFFAHSSSLSLFETLSSLPSPPDPFIH